MLLSGVSRAHFIYNDPDKNIILVIFIRFFCIVRLTFSIIGAGFIFVVSSNKLLFYVNMRKYLIC